MRSIWKFEFKVDDEITIQMPAGGKLLKVSVQNPNMICVWMLVDPEAKTVPYRFAVRGTGHPVHPDLVKCYLDTVFDPPFVWHVFMRGT